MQANPIRKPARKSLPNPSVFKVGVTWVCEYYYFDEEGRRKPRRKSFLRDLKRVDIEPTLQAQRKAANEFRDAMLKEKKEQERLNRRDRDQKYLTLSQLKEAKAAFIVYDDIQYRKKSLLEAVILYRESLKLAVDSPLLRIAVEVFLGRKLEAAESDNLSMGTYRTLSQRLNHLVGHFMQKGLPSIKIGDVSSKQLIGYFESLKVSDRTRVNYMNDIGNFFNDASDPKDKDRFINENPMDGVHVHFRKHNKGKAAKGKRAKQKAPTVLQLDRSKHVLDLAFEMREQGMLGFTVAGFLLGMRPSEVFDMVAVPNFWEKYIKFEEGIVRIDGFGKKRDQRIIVMGDACKAWLQYIKERNLPFCFPIKKNGQNLQYANFRAKAFLPDLKSAERLIKLRRLHKTKKKPSVTDKEFMDTCNSVLQVHADVLRHTHGTNFYYANGCDKNLTIERMGHSADVFVDNYRGLLDRPEDAERFFNELHPDEFIEKLVA